MITRPLGQTGLDVSLLTLGTMTWGQQNTEAEAHAQIDQALAAGVNLLDAAEMYPVPPMEETYGATERIIGNWFSKTGRRNEVLLATKAMGPGMVSYVRGGPRLTREQVIAACEASLKRLQTDVIDLYQLHWPERPTNYFGKLSYTHNDRLGAPIEETLRALETLVQSGKVRHIGVSNETPWGVAEYLRLSRDAGLPRIASIQNPYSLLNRSFEIGLAEFAHREQVGLLAYSPLAFGMLSGKYLGDIWPANGRLTLFKRFSRYNGEQGVAATRAYVSLARDHGLDPVHLALAFVNQQPFVTSTIIGATTPPQLAANLASVAVELSDEVIKGIDALHQRYTIPCP
ncbi:MAG: NADP(H)-dependent aldo-keto reductase [Polycyclovorans sp.]